MGLLNVHRHEWMKLGASEKSTSSTNISSCRNLYLTLFAFKWQQLNSILFKSCSMSWSKEAKSLFHVELTSLVLKKTAVDQRRCSVVSTLWPHGLWPNHSPPSMEFSRQGYWSGLPFPSPGSLPTQGSNPGLLHCRQTLYCLSRMTIPKPFPGHCHFPIQEQGRMRFESRRLSSDKQIPRRYPLLSYWP